MQFIMFFCACFLATANLAAETFMMNPYGCSGLQSLNGKWNAIIDIFGKGEAMKFYLNHKPAKDTEIVEYAFGGGLTLDVPGDFNSQSAELKYYEGNVWYQRTFTAPKNKNRRQFLYFAGVNYEATVWLNGVFLGRHEGGFTPFEF